MRQKLVGLAMLTTVFVAGWWWFYTEAHNSKNSPCCWRS